MKKLTGLIGEKVAKKVIVKMDKPTKTGFKVTEIDMIKEKLTDITDDIESIKEWKKRVSTLNTETVAVFSAQAKLNLKVHRDQKHLVDVMTKMFWIMGLALALCVSTLLTMIILKQL